MAEKQNLFLLNMPPPPAKDHDLHSVDIISDMSVNLVSWSLSTFLPKLPQTRILTKFGLFRVQKGTKNMTPEGHGLHTPHSTTYIPK